MTGPLRWYGAGVCACFAFAGGTLAFFGDSFLFEPYNQALRDIFFEGGAPSPGAAGFQALTLGQLGGTQAGRWAMLALIVWHGWKRRRRWVQPAVTASLLISFVIDSAISVFYGAVFNVWMMNIAPMLLLLPAMALMYRFRPLKGSREPGEPDREFQFWYRWMLIASILPAAQGVFTAIFASPDPFDIYANHIREFFWAADIPAADDRFRRFLLGSLGGALAGYFTAQYFLVRFTWSRRLTWGRDAIAAGLLLWFTVDSTVSIMHGAWFNLYLVNVPTLIAIGMPLLMTRRYFS